MTNITTKYDAAGGVELRKGTKSVYFQPGDDVADFEDEFNEAFNAPHHVSHDDVMYTLWDQYEHIAQED